MPEEPTTPDVAHIKNAYTAFNRRDWDAFFAEVDPDFEFAPAEENVTYRGREAVVQYFERWLDAWEQFEIEPEHIDAGPTGRRMFSVMHYRARSAASAVPIEGRFFHVTEWRREGRPWRVRSYADEAEARAAAQRLANERDKGVSEKTTTPDLVEVVRSFAESAPNDLEAYLGFFANDAVWEAVPLGAIYHGIDEIRAFLTDWIGSYEDYEIEEQEVRDLGNGVIIAVVDQVTRLPGSTAGSRMSEKWAFVFAWTDGRVVRVVANNDVDQAGAAAERLAKERQ